MSEANTRGKLQLHWKMLIGFLAGLALGLVAHYLSGADAGWVKWLTTYVTQPAGTLFLRLIFMLVIPLLFSALVIGVAWGQEKVKAIKACLVGGYISALATDQATAESLLA